MRTTAALISSVAIQTKMVMDRLAVYAPMTRFSGNQHDDDHHQVNSAVIGQIRAGC
ncbi:hypothetical protein [Chromobacterium alticapitis]|uniref:hypothetical protein n=1 Tax=Chromobacterium alticapitis TaxID=2073169 RepID=UPI001304F3F2|nr:hypothetical protein [Chromobacterium alticapitis]